MASQRKPPSPLIQSISAPFERSPGWVKILYWCILGVVSAVLVATLISCPILLLLRFLHPGDFQTILTQNQTDTTLTATPGGSPGSSTPSSGTGSASEGTAASSTPTAEAQADSTDSSLSPTGSPENGTDSASSVATGTAASGESKSSATPGGIDSSGSSGSDSESSSAAGTPTDGGSTTLNTLDADSADGASSQSTSAAKSAALTATASLIEPSPTFTPIPPSPTSTPTPIPPSSTPTPTPTIPTATPTPRGPTPPPRRTPAPYTVVAPSNPAPPPTPVPLPTNTPRPTSTPTLATPTRVAVQPLSTRIVAPAAAPNLPSGILSLLDPISIQIPPSRGPTTFVWEWEGDALPSEFGFEVRVWLNGEPQAGVHDAVLDRQEGRIDYLGVNRYQLKVGNIRYAKGVLGREGIYNWTVAVVRVSPAYADFGLQAVPARFRYEPFPVGR